MRFRWHVFEFHTEIFILLSYKSSRKVHIEQLYTFFIWTSTNLGRSQKRVSFKFPLARSTRSKSRKSFSFPLRRKVFVCERLLPWTGWGWNWGERVVWVFEWEEIYLFFLNWTLSSISHSSCWCCGINFIKGNSKTYNFLMMNDRNLM